MIAASGIYFHEVIEAIVYTEGVNYLIPDMSFDDIAQEIRLECLRVLPAYNPERIGPSPYNYLKTCVKNKLYNLRRGIYVPNNPPCNRCPLWDKGSKECRISEIGCKEIKSYRKMMAAKASLKSPRKLDGESFCVTTGKTLGDQEARMLHEDIKQILPDKLIPDYEKMVFGDASKVSANNKRKIREIVRSFLDDAESE